MYAETLELLCVVWGSNSAWQLLVDQALIETHKHKHKLTGNGAADLAPPGSDTGTVPDHAILGSLVGFSHGVVQLVDLIEAPFLCYGEKTMGNVCFVKERGKWRQI